MIWFLIYIVGYLLAFRQCRLNFLYIDESRTRQDLLVCVGLSFFSWVMWILAAYAYLQEVEDTPLKRWLEKDLQPKNKKESE